MKKVFFLMLIAMAFMIEPTNMNAQEDEGCPDPSEDCDVDNGGGNGNGEFDGDCWNCSEYMPGVGVFFGIEITCRPGLNVCHEAECQGGTCG